MRQRLAFLLVAALALPACGEGTRETPPQPDQTAELERFVARANDVCADHARRSRRLTVELTDYKPEGQETVDLSTILANPALLRRVRRNAAARRRLGRRTSRRLGALPVPSGARPVVRRWLIGHKGSFGPGVLEPGYDQQAESRRRGQALRADLYALLLGLDRCPTVIGDDAAVEQLVSYAVLAGGPGAVPPRTEHGRVARVLDGRTVELTTGDEVRLAQFAAPGGDCGEPARRALAKALGRRPLVDLELVIPARDGQERIAYIFKKGRNVNLGLAASGSGLVGTSEAALPLYRPYLLAAAQLARTTRNGLWRSCPADAS